MKRFHVHVVVEDLEQSIRFYSTLFATEPEVREADYAKWMLDDPRLNFAISQREGAAGVEHLGFQAEDEGELAEIYERLARAERPVLEQKAVSCCYAKSDKQWISDPQGVTWETFMTHGTATVYGESRAVAALKELSHAGACGKAKPDKNGVQKAGCCPA
jgi:catechol 2,3-dioxygenase-like lactoylglutathione lyase family enzyme